MEGSLVKKGRFYFIFERGADLVLEDKTKRGLEVREHAIDDRYSVEADKGIIYDMDGIGHKVGIRWYFPRSEHSLEQVTVNAEEMESRYRALREMTCPDD